MQRVAPNIYADSTLFPCLLPLHCLLRLFCNVSQHCAPLIIQTLSCHSFCGPNAKVIVISSHASNLNRPSHPGRSAQKLAPTRLKAGHPTCSIIQRPSRHCSTNHNPYTTFLRQPALEVCARYVLARTASSQHGALTRRPQCRQTWHLAL